MCCRCLLYSPILLAALTLAGCIGTSTPVSQYILAAPVLSGQSEYPAYTGRSMILVGPVQLPQQLAGQGIVTRPKSTVVNTSAVNFWAAPLDEQIGTVVSRHLAALLQTDKIAPYPGPRFGDKAYQVELVIEHFSGTLNDKFTCRLHWTLNDLRTRTIIRQESFSLTVPVAGNSYQGYTAAASECLAEFSTTQLAKAITNLMQANKNPHEQYP